jgi:hypothetical protein
MEATSSLLHLGKNERHAERDACLTRLQNVIENVNVMPTFSQDKANNEAF